MTKSGDTIATPPDASDLEALFSAVDVGDAPSSSSAAPQPQVLFSNANVGGIANALPQNSSSELFSVICFDTKSSVETVCGGFIAGDTSRFCLKPAAHTGLSNCCTTVKHLSDKFSLLHHRCYVIKSITSAFTAPEGDIAHLSPIQVEFLRNTKRPLQDWQNLFTLQANSKFKAEPKSEQETERKLKLLDKRVILQTPAKQRISNAVKVESDEDDTFFDTETVTRFELPADAPQSWQILPDSFKSFFGSLVNGTSDLSAQTFGLMRDVRTIEKVYGDIGSDLETLDIRYQSLQGKLGEIIKIGNVEVPNLNAGMGVLLERIKNNETAINNLVGSVSDGMEDIMNGTKAFENTQNNRWLSLAPLVQQMKTVIKSTIHHPLESIATRLDILEAKAPQTNNPHNHTVRKSNVSDQRARDTVLDSLFSTSEPPDLQPSNLINPELVNDNIAKILEDIKTLMARTSGDGFRLRNFNFQSIEELNTWVQTHVTGHRFGLFVDGVSLWEYYRHGHFSMPEVLASMRDTTRVGFATVQEARVATSFENVLPAVLGKGTDPTKSLPGLPTHKVWDAGDGSNGLRFLLNDYNTNVYTQLADQIQNTFEAFTSPARTLALECLQRAIQFVNELSNYITRFHAELINSGSFTPEQCWQLVSRCIKRCFHDMGAIRVTAKDGRLEDDPIKTATTYIWGTLRTHTVMQEYIKYNFEDHPAFASVITRFVTNNNYQSNIRSLADKVEKQDKAIIALGKRVDTLYNRMSNVEKKVE